MNYKVASKNVLENGEIDTIIYQIYYGDKLNLDIYFLIIITGMNREY